MNGVIGKLVAGALEQGDVEDKLDAAAVLACRTQSTWMQAPQSQVSTMPMAQLLSRSPTSR